MLKTYQPYGTTQTNWATQTSDTILTRKPDINPIRKWEYEDGLVMTGIYQVYQETKDPKYLEYLRYNMDLFVDGTGNIANYFYDEFNLDHVNNGKVLLDLYEETGDIRYKKAADKLYQQLLHQPRTSEGTFWHKNIYPYQIWLDGLYMGSVFYGRYKNLFEPTDFEDVVHQFLNAYDNTLDVTTGLCFHAYDEKRVQNWANKTTGHSPHIWVRALGWYVMSIVDVYEYIPDETPGKEQMMTNLLHLMEAIQNYADPETNLWYQIVDQGDRPGNYLESSGSFMILTTIAKGIRKGYFDEAYWGPILEKGYKNGLEQFITITNDQLVNVNKMCHVAGLGGIGNRDGSFAYYMSEPIVANDHKGVGPFILASLEMNKRQK
ncbi:MAG: glycoside hydrolase family 105 protein [Enterococcus sp.]